MGQYHYLVNLTKKQFIHPHRIGNGFKLREQVGWECSTSTALVMLLASSNGRGGGDFYSKSPLVGSWAGDSIAFLGDYAELDDLPNHRNKTGWNAPSIYNCVSGKFTACGWKDISGEVRKMMAKEFDIHYTGEDGEWLTVEKGPAPKPTRKSWVEENPKVEFDYPSSKHNGKLTYRKVRVITANSDYIQGLDTLDKNRFKKFKRSRIVNWIGKELLTFSTGQMPLFY
jgi:hypothetical protein